MSAQVAYLGTCVPDWVRELSSSDPLQRRLGAYALGEIGPAATEAVSDLAAALRDPVAFVRVWAAGTRPQERIVRLGSIAIPRQSLPQNALYDRERMVFNPWNCLPSTGRSAASTGCCSPPILPRGRCG